MILIKRSKGLVWVVLLMIFAPLSTVQSLELLKNSYHSRIPTLFTSLTQNESIEAKLIRGINHGLRSRTMDLFMISVTQLGSWYGAPAVCTGFWVFGEEKGKDTGKLGLTALGGSAVITLGFKYIVRRTRPYKVFEDEEWFRPYGPNEHTPSFPSGHTTAAFALATIIADEYTEYAIPAYVLATLVGISRIYLGQHYPSDILVGAAIGFGTAKLATYYKDKILEVIPW